jgi:hypothetical protein
MNQNHQTNKNFSNVGTASSGISASKTALAVLGDKKGVVSGAKISPNWINFPCYDPMSPFMLFPMGFLVWLIMKIITFFKK